MTGAVLGDEIGDLFQVTGDEWGQAVVLRFQPVEDRIRVESLGFVGDRFMPRFTQIGQALLPEFTFVRPVAQGVADDLAIGGVFAPSTALRTKAAISAGRAMLSFSMAGMGVLQ